MDNDERLTQLEMKFSYLENDIHELNNVIIEQGKTIRKLAADNEELRRQLLAAGEGAVSEKPPHY